MLLRNSLRYNRDEKYEETEKRINKLFELLKEVQEVRNNHPNVPMTVLYSSQIDTIYQYITDEDDPIDSHSDDQLYDKGRFMYRKGDGSIEIT